MRLDDESESSNVEDRRGSGMGKAGGVGIGTVVIALIASYFLGIDPRTLIGVAETVQNVQQSPSTPVDPATDPDAALKSEMAKVLRKTETSWDAIFQQMGGQYHKPVLVLYRGQTPTACGAGQAAMGPFYCPGDQKVYLDMVFFREMETRFRAGGDFARAYVIAHEIGHHVQKLTGISDKTEAMRGRMSEREYNKVSVRVELQADCFAGVWAQHAQSARQILENGDIESAMNAAARIGDDALQKQSQGYVVPESFTHGTSAQRTRWFNNGLQNGSVKACDTFSTKNL